MHGRCNAELPLLRRIATADGEDQATILGSPIPIPHDEPPPNRRYVPCPRCRELMTPMQFSRRSGVIIDICRSHGVWFDRDELRRIIEFIRAGGLDRARALDKEELARAKRELDALRDTTAEERLASIASTGSILATLLRD